MSATISVRITGAKLSATSNQKRHDVRIGKQPAYVDQARKDLNSIVIRPKTGAQLHKMCEELRFGHGAKRKMKSNAHVSTNGIITFGTEAQSTIGNLSVQQQDALFADASKKIAIEFDNIVTGLVVHRDESAIHAHFQMPATNQKGIPNSKFHVDYSKLQDIAGQCVSSLGINRGVKKSERIANGEPDHKHIHMSVQKLHSLLPRQIKEAEDAISKAKSHLKTALTPIPATTLKPIRAEIVKKKKRLGYDETVCAKVYTPKQIDAFLREQYTKSRMLEHTSADASEALRALKTAEAESMRLRELETRLTRELRESKERCDDLERVLHDRNVNKADLDSEIANSKRSIDRDHRQG